MEEERGPAGRLFLSTWRWATGPLRRMWDSNDPIDSYALVHLASAAGDTLVAMALADSVFFSIPVGQAKIRVALYLALTMAPLAVAGPLLVPLLDRGGFRRAISFGAAAGRAVVAIFAAPRFSTLLLFPSAFLLLVLSKVHGITKNGLTAAYAPAHEGLLKVNARLGRVAVAGALVASVPGLIILKLGGARQVLYLAAVAYVVCSLLNLRLDQPDPPEQGGGKQREPTAVPEAVERRGRLPSLGTAAGGAAGLRAASGFLLFLLAFALREGGYPTYWFGVLAVSAGVGGFLGDVVAPRLSVRREENVVFGALIGAGAGALCALVAFELFVIALFVALAGMATESGRLAFQSLMQRRAPPGAHGRVFVRYEVLFQLAWVAGAFLPAVLPISFRTGVLLMAVFYLGVAVVQAVVPWPGRGAVWPGPDMDS